MTASNDIPTFDHFSRSNDKLTFALIAFGEFIDNMKLEHQSYTLLEQIYGCLNSAHEDLERCFTSEFDQFYQSYEKRSQNGLESNLRPFQVISGGKQVNSEKTVR